MVFYLTTRLFLNPQAQYQFWVLQMAFEMAFETRSTVGSNREALEVRKIKDSYFLRFKGCRFIVVEATDRKTKCMHE